MSNLPFIPRFVQDADPRLDMFQDYREEGGLAGSEGYRDAFAAKKHVTQEGLVIEGVCNCSRQFGITLEYKELACLAGNVSPTEMQVDAGWRMAHDSDGTLYPTRSMCPGGCAHPVFVHVTPAEAYEALRRGRDFWERDGETAQVIKHVELRNARMRQQQGGR